MDARLPGTDLTVSRICLGNAEIGLRGSQSEAHALLDRFVAAGGSFLDTARVYSDWVPGETGRSERIIGDWLSRRPDRSHLVIATKAAHPPLSDMTHSQLSREDILGDVSLSLAALRVTAIDLLYLHRDDTSLPVGQIVDSLEECVRRGLIRYYACSNWTPSRVRQAVAYAKKAGYQGFVANQVMWNIGVNAMNPPADATLVRFDSETENLHRETGMPIIPFSSQAGGFFDKAAAEDPPASLLQSSPYWTEKNLALARLMKEVAREHGLSLSGLALAYLLSQDLLVVPVVGCHTVSQLDDSLRALEARLDATTRARLDAAAGFTRSTS